MSGKVIPTYELHSVGEGDKHSTYAQKQYGTLLNNRTNIYGVINKIHPLREFTQFNCRMQPGMIPRATEVGRFAHKTSYIGAKLYIEEMVASVCRY